MLLAFFIATFITTVAPNDLNNQHKTAQPSIFYTWSVTLTIQMAIIDTVQI